MKHMLQLSNIESEDKRQLDDLEQKLEIANSKKRVAKKSQVGSRKSRRLVSTQVTLLDV